jgi:hypothetical protein
MQLAPVVVIPETTSKYACTGLLNVPLNVKGNAPNMGVKNQMITTRARPSC